jgi:plastocyanin
MTQSWGRIPTRAITAAASAAAGVTLLAACAAPTNTAAEAAASTPIATTTGGQATQPPPGMAGMAAPGPGAGAADEPVATNAVAIQNFAFSPATVTVKAGTTITWTNQDQDPHTVTAMNNGPFHSTPLNNGESYHYTFTTPGHFDYLCTIHPFMTATVVVTP